MSAIDSSYRNQVEQVLSNPGLRTNLFFNAVAGTVDFTPACIAINSPGCRDYYFGNYLILYRPPGAADVDLLESRFAALIGTQETLAHQVFVWSADATIRLDIARFLERGYHYACETVLLIEPKRLISSKPLESRFSIRRYHQPDDWAQWYALQMEDKQAVQDDEKYHAYLRFLQSTYIELIKQGRGAWWGAFDGARQVANLGLFFDGDIGRFQSVYTQEQYRNQGLCRALLAAAALDASTIAQQLVIVADDDYYALGLYEKMGFKATHKIASLCKV